MGTTAIKAGLVAAVMAATAPALAAPTLDGVIGDHAVLQRSRPIVLTGRSAPGETVTIAMAGRTATVKAGRDGTFRATLAALAAGGPYDMVVTAKSGSLVVRDLLVGDVFLCSGQSNMEMTVEGSQGGGFARFGAADDQLRLTTIAKASTVSRQPLLASPAVWAAASANNVPRFSAACYYMVQSLRQTQKVPIGAIVSAWSGSRISSWLNEPGLRESGLGPDLDILKLYQREGVAGMRAASARFEQWWREQSGDKPGAEPWQPDAALDWKAMPRVGPFKSWGIEGVASYQGMVWFRREVTLTPEQARQPALLTLGLVDDADRTWINGKPVGGSSNAGLHRAYPVPADTLTAGRNVITINDDNNYMDGGLLGPAEVMKLTFADGTSIPLSEQWRYALGGPVKVGPPRSPWDDIRGAGTLYNAMIAPLGPVALAGVAWYQGESDVDIPRYDARLGAMMKDWRRQFGVPDLPFAIVQLPDFGPFATSPVESGWPVLRNEQRLAVEADGHAGVAVTIDVGDPLDLHPPRKREVGQRLARVMHAMAYKETVSPSGPRIESASRTTDGGVTLHFADVTGALETRGAAQAIGFELCGPATGSCRYATARPSGSDVILTGDGKPVARVRYAWAESPTINLFDQALLPAGPFEIAVK